MPIVNESSLPVLEGPTSYEEDLAAVVSEIREGLHVEKVLMEEQMARNAKYEEAITDACTVDGLGQRTGVIPARVYFRWIHQEGVDFWRDPKNRERFFRENPQCRAAKPQRKYF